MKLTISRVASTLVTQASLFECSIEEAWESYIHPFITERFEYEEVKAYIDKKIELGESVGEDVT